MSRMFPFITGTWNPVAGECPYDCVYCWAKSLIKRNDMVKYRGPAHLDEKALSKIPDSGFVFAQDMSDISVLDHIDAKRLVAEFKKRPSVEWLTLTKNPAWYRSMAELNGVEFPSNVILGATIETNVKIEVSKAPRPIDRLVSMMWVKDHLPNRVFISVEPIMDFRWEFADQLAHIGPWGVAVGYDNYHNGLPEPSLSKTLALIDTLEKHGIQVYRKTLREKK